MAIVSADGGVGAEFGAGSEAESVGPVGAGFFAGVAIGTCRQMARGKFGSLRSMALAIHS